MKRAILATVMALSMAAACPAVELGIGLQWGMRTVAGAPVRDVYGNGMTWFPLLRVTAWKGLELGAGYEGGYKRNGLIGIFQEKATLEVTGFEFFAGYGFRLNKVEPYGRLGYGRYRYRQRIESEFAPDDVDRRESAVTLAAGVRVYPWKGAWLSLEAKFVPLRVKPMDVEVDLGGWRLSLGAGCSFALFNPVARRGDRSTMQADRGLEPGRHLR